jgi:hypothetical protein
MIRLNRKKAIVKPRPAMYNGLDSHKWQTKIEIVRLISGKPDLRINTFSIPGSQMYVSS